MQLLFALPFFLLQLVSFLKPAPEPVHAVSFYDFTLNSIDGKPVNFGQYKGKKVMLVNVASKCGYTPQYKQLEELHKKHGDKVVILGFPANNYGAQEPGTNKEISEFCQKNYGVTFQMFEKISVTGDDKHPLYQWLSDPHLNGWNSEGPKWNFHKFLVNEQGKLVKVWPSKVDPMSKEIVEAVNQK